MAYKALLIGASTYDDPAIGDLPFVTEDLRRLQGALSKREFGSVEILEAPRGIIRTTVNARVGGFLREARRDDVLLIVLSGHGQRFEGADYLIPEDASFAIRPFADCCVEIGWHKELEHSAAAQVVFLIDACREGFARDAKSPAGVQGWGKQRIAAALRRKVAYVYACSPAQVALFVRPTDTAADGGTAADSFSLFSRAVAEVVTEVPHAVDLGEFRQQVQDRISALHTAYRKAGGPQVVRVVTDIDTADVTVLPGPPEHAAQHPWVRSVAGHAAWERTPAGAARDALKAVCEALAARLAADFEESASVLRHDPWHDAELAARTQDRMDFLVRRFDDADTHAFSPTEAALTALLPLVGQAFWTHQAARRSGVLDGSAPRSDRERFQAFARSHPRLMRRLGALGQAGDPRGDAVRIRRWLFHRWLLHQPELYTGTALGTLLAPPTAPTAPTAPGWAASALDADRFGRFLQDRRKAPFALTEAFAAPDVVAASTGDEHGVRQDMVAALVKTAHALAVDPVDLSEIVAEHLGISDAVDLTELLTTLRASDWRGSGVGRSLNAACGHPAVQIALREHAARTDALLRDISRTAAGPLRTLPPYADADLVRLTGGAPQHLTEGIRFQLAEDRVQELLMGESLYGGRELAIRELYQNALDAVRHRDARTEYLRRTGDRPPRLATGWSGEIAFRQGVGADGRAYLECRDNGVGMGLTELTRAFAQGGTRFVDLPEYAEEQAEWSQLDPPVVLYPNSRFGIGVLSYFMLADEIEVRTCRFGRDGRPGRELRVTIAGPGNLFRVEDLGPGDEAGTSVRLSLSRGRADVSCVQVLDRLLWVAPYRTLAEHGTRRLEWRPGLLERPLPGTPVCEPPLATSCPDVWWTSGDGVLLSDGLAVSAVKGVPRSVVVNLHGPKQPELTASRTHVIRFDTAYVEELAVRAAADAVRDGTLLTPNWLSQLGSSSLTVADAVAAAAERAGARWVVGDRATCFDAVGHFPPDRLLFLLLTGEAGGFDRRKAAALLRCLPAHLLRWRIPAIARAVVDPTYEGPAPEGPSCAWPSDIRLLNAGDLSTWEEELPRWCADPYSGSPALPYDGTPEAVVNAALALLALTDWRPARTRVDVATILDNVQHCGRTAGPTAERYRRLGFRHQPLGGLESAARPDLPLLHPLGAPGGWLPPGAELSAAQVSFSAALADLPVSAAARRLRDLGFTVPDAVADRSRWTPEQRGILRELWRYFAAAPPPAQAVDIRVAQLVLAAQESGEPVHELAALLRALGFRVPPDGDLPHLTGDDWWLLTVRGRTPYVDRPVPSVYHFAAAVRTGRSPEDVSRRLAALGFRVREISADDRGRYRDAINVIMRFRKDGSGPVPRLELAYWRGGTRSGSDKPPAPSSVIPSPAHLYALAEHRGVSSREGDARDLAAMGFELPPEDPDFERDVRAEQYLHVALAHPRDPLVPSPEHTAISLPALAAVAFRYGRTLRDTARTASALGLRHEAESWFGPAPVAPPRDPPLRCVRTEQAVPDL